MHIEERIEKASSTHRNEKNDNDL